MSFKSALNFSNTPYIQRHLEKNQGILKVILSCSPDPLKHYIQDCVVNETTLKIYVSSAVCSSQLRFITPHILNTVNSEKNLGIEQIIIKVLPPQDIKPVLNKPKKIKVSNYQLTNLHQCALDVEEGPLKKALLKLSKTLHSRH